MTSSAVDGYTVRHYRGCDVRAFCNDAVRAVFDGDMAFHEFALGFAAAIDALAGGRANLSDAVGTVRRAWLDVNDVSRRVPSVTDVMQAYCEGVAARRAV